MPGTRRQGWSVPRYAETFGEETLEFISVHANDVHDADVGEDPDRGPPVDRRGADADQLRDLADGEELLERR